MKDPIVASRTFLSNIVSFWFRHTKADHEDKKGLRQKKNRPMTEHCRFWVVAVPTVGGSVARTLATLASATAALGLSVNNELRVPRLQVGTLDTLMGLSDAIAKVDEQAEAIVKKISKQYLDTIEERSEKKLSQRSETALFVDNDSPAAFVRKFTWDRARYPLSAPLGSLIETIGSGCVKYGEDLRMLSFKYNETKTNMTALNRKESGSLLVRPLSLIVGPKDMVEGEYLESIVVIVALARENEWLTTYERIEDDYVPAENVIEANPFSTHSVKCRAVVPGSSLELYRDQEYIAYRVVLIKKCGHIFKESARVKRFICREYHYDEAEVANSAAAKLQLQKEVDYLWRNLVKWCATAYSEVFKAWIHIKVIRVFIESVLRFGLPIDFAVATLEVKPDKEEPLRTALLRLYSHLSGANMTQTADEIDYSGVGADFYPYVFLKIDA